MERGARHVLSLTAFLCVLWALLSGRTEPLIVGLGIASVALVVYLAHRMDVIDHESQPVHLTWRLVTYFPWLAWQIVKANVDVMKAVLDPRLPIQPQVFTVRARQRSELNQVVFANSITLTPGTVTIAVADGTFEVHALTVAAAADLMDDAATGAPSEMNARCAALEDRAWRDRA